MATHAEFATLETQVRLFLLDERQRRKLPQNKHKCHPITIIIIKAALSVLHFQKAVHHALIKLDKHKLPSQKTVLSLGLPRTKVKLFLRAEEG